MQLGPRDTNQLKNLSSKESRGKRISSCDITAAMAMQRSHFSFFIRSIRSEPDLQIFCGLDEAFDLANRVFKRSEKSVHFNQLLSYDTTFNIGEHYISILLAQNFEVQGDKMFPVAYFIHERKRCEDHRAFFDFVFKKLQINDHIPIVTDRERAITTILTSSPQLVNQHFSCTQPHFDQRQVLG